MTCEAINVTKAPKQPDKTSYSYDEEKYLFVCFLHFSFVLHTSDIEPCKIMLFHKHYYAMRFDYEKIFITIPALLLIEVRQWAVTCRRTCSNY